MSNEFLIILRWVEHQELQYFVTFDESWFYLSTDYQIVWVPDRQNNDDHNRMDSPQFHIVDVFRMGKSFNAGHYLEYILQSIPELCPASFRLRFLIHADNDGLHTARQSQGFCEQNSLSIAPYPPYSLVSDCQAPALSGISK
jgi:hypothetical protein